MQDDPTYDDVVDDVRAFLAERLEFATSRGIAEERIRLDPGIGFGKTLDHNLELLRRLGELRDLGRPLVVGTSRKSFIGKITGREVDERLGGTIASCVLAYAERGRDAARARRRAGARRAAGRRGDPRRARVGDPVAARSASFAAWRRTTAGHPRRSRSRSAACRSTPTTASPTPSRRSASGSSSTSRFDVPDCDAVLTDRLDDTVDYAEVCDIVVLAATERSYRTLERLCQVVAERLMERYGSETVRVRAAKPEPPLPLAIEEVAVEVVRSTLTAEPAPDEDDRSRRPIGRVGYLSLGSNVGDREANMRAAIEALGAHGVEVEAVSGLYETEPVGEILDQPDFLNAAARISTALEPRGAARRLQGDRGRAGEDVRRAAPRAAADRHRHPAARRPRASAATA